MNLSGDFNLHVRLLRQRNRHIRLTRGAILLLLAAVICWLAGFGFAAHVGLSLLAGVVGVVLPVAGSRDWAFGYITQQSGLAYETALVIEQQPRDEHGFRNSVRSRARAGIAGMDQPKFNEWWLAALILAAAIILLPVLQLSPPWSGTPAQPPPENPLAASPDAPADEAEDDDPAAEEPLPEPEAEELVAPQVEQAAGDSQEPGSAASAESPGTEREGDVLDRFLDNLRERPREPEPAPEVPGSPVPADAEDSERSDDEQESESTAPFDEDAEDGDEADSDSQTGAEAAADSGEGDQQEELDQPGPEQQGEQNEPAGDGEQPGDAPSPADDEDPDGTQGLTEGEDGDSAGGGPGVEDFSEEQERFRAEGEEDFLEGQLQGNEVNIGGDVRLPGFSDVELPPDASPGRLGEAVERSLTGGNVPLEYQDIIRNYFR